MEQARERFQQATGEQKDMYKARLQEMEVKLEEAREKKDRARSMAEQTKKGTSNASHSLGVTAGREPLTSLPSFLAKI